MTKPSKWLWAQRSLRSAWADAQADLSLRWAHSHFTWAHSHFVGFVTRRLMKSGRRNEHNDGRVCSRAAMSNVYTHSSTLSRSFEPSHEIMVLFVLRKLILQTCMRSHPVGLDVWFSVGSFDYFHTLCVRTAKSYVISTIRWSPVWYVP